LERYGAAPLRYYYEIFDRDACRRHGLERSPDRARELMALSETMVQQFSDQPGLEIPAPEVRPTPWLDRAVAPIVSALVNGAPHAGFANLTNGKNIPELPPELVVELGATFTSQGACPITPGPLPARVAQFLGHIADAEALTFRAAEQRDPALLAEAIRALPLPIPEATVQELASLAQRDVGTREQS
jgi:alpha-galactosidase/6-phospho-beta-glucosidase family protein